MLQSEPSPEPYPITARPATGELAASYILRLAVLNSIDPNVVLDQVADGSFRTKAIPPEQFRYRVLQLNHVALARLAAISGYPARTLRLALCYHPWGPGSFRRPAVKVPHYRRWPRSWMPSPACPDCFRRHGDSPLPIIEFRDDRVHCRRHRIWLADQVHTAPFRLDGHRELLAAIRRMQRIYRQHGRKRTSTSFNIAHNIWFAYRIGINADADPIIARWDGRATRMNLPTRGNPLAPRFPEIAILTDMIASWRWRAAAARPHVRRARHVLLDQRQRLDVLDFLDELARRLDHPAPFEFRRFSSSVRLWADSIQPGGLSPHRHERGGPIDIDLQRRRGHLTKIK